MTIPYAFTSSYILTEGCLNFRKHVYYHWHKTLNPASIKISGCFVPTKKKKNWIQTLVTKFASRSKFIKSLSV